MKAEATAKPASGPLTAAAVEHLQEWDPQFAQLLEKMAANPWSNGILPRKTVELVGLAVNAACTNLNADGTRQHITGHNFTRCPTLLVRYRESRDGVCVVV